MRTITFSTYLYYLYLGLSLSLGLLDVQKYNIVEE